MEMEIQIHLYVYNESIYPMCVNSIFFLGIKNTKLEIRNSVFDETKGETKSY